MSGLSAGSVYGVVGVRVDDSGFDKYGRRLSEARRDGDRGAKAHLRAEVDERPFSRFGGLLRGARRDSDDASKGFGVLASSASGAGDAIGGSLGQSLIGSTSRVERFGVAAIVASPQIVGLAGAATALAGSAAAAAGGLGALGIAAGAIASPIAALSLGLVARFNLIGEAIKAVTAEHDKAGANAQASAATQAAAAQRVQGAEQALGDAKRNVTRTEEALTIARRQARDELEGLARASEHAVLSEKRAAITLREALEAAAKVQADPTHTRLELDAANQSVLEARSNLKDLHTDRIKAQSDQASADRAGVDGARRVVEARRQVSDAHRGETRARQSLTAAIDANTASIGKQSAASSAAAAALAKLTPVERKFVDTWRGVGERVRKAFQPATDAVIAGLDLAVRRGAGLADRLSSPFRHLGEAARDGVDRVSKSLTGPAWTSAFTRFTNSATRLMAPASKAFVAFADLIRQIAIAALPTLEGALKDAFGGIVNLDKATGPAKVRDVVLELLRHTRSWWELTKQVGELLYRVLGGGAAQGKGLVDTLTRVLDHWNAILATKDGQDRLHRFFADSVRTTKELAGFLRDVFNVLHDHWTLIRRLTEAWVAYRAAAILAGVAAKGVGAVKTAGRIVDRIRGGGGGAVEAVLGARGATPENPVFVLDVRGGGGGGPGGGPWSRDKSRTPYTKPGGGTLAEGEQAASRFGRLKGLAKFGAKLGAAAAAVDFAVNLVDSRGNPLAATINSAHDLTFGITPKVKVISAGDRESKQLQDYAKRVQDAINAGDPAKVHRLRTEIGRMADEAKRFGDTKLAARWKDLGDSITNSQVTTEVGKAAAVFADWRRTGSNDLKSLRGVVAQTTGDIRDHLGKDTAEGKDAAAKNFHQAQQAIRDAMADGKVSVRSGLAYIKRLFHAEMREYGLDAKSADRYKASPTGNSLGGGREGGSGTAGGALNNARGGWVKRAAGGWIGSRGMVSGDVVPIAPGVMAAYGEFDANGPGGRRAVLNRHQAPMAELALAAGGYPGLDQLPAGGQLPYLEQAFAPLGGLDSLFDSIRTPHYLASGGIVPVPGFPGERAAARVIPAIERIARRFRLILTDAFGPGHKSPGHTIYGTAADFAGPDGNMDDAVKYLVGQGYLVGYDGRFGSQRWPGHGPTRVAGSNAHLHVELASKGARAIAGALRRIKAPNLGGSGDIGAIAQSLVNRAARGANATIRRASSSPVPGGGDPRALAADANVVSGFRRAMRDQHASPVERLAGWEAGIVESGLKNLQYGDADSLGALQERASIFGRGHALNPYASMTRFLRDAIGRRPWRRSAGMLAAAVQRPAAQFRGRYDAVAGRARRYLAGGGYAGYVANQAAGAAGEQHAAGAARSGLSIRTLGARQTDRVKAYDDVLKDVDRERKRYEQADRFYNQSTETLIDPVTGELDQGAIDKRVGELEQLLHARERIVRLLERARTIARRIVHTYTTIVNRLTRSLRHAKHKDRSGIRAQIKAYKTNRGEWAAKIGEQLTPDIVDAQLDVGDIAKEIGEVKGTTASPTSSTSGDANLQAIADQANKRADDLAADLAAARQNLAVFGGPGDLGAGGANAFAAGTFAGALGTDPAGPFGQQHPVIVAGKPGPAGAAVAGAGPNVTLQVHSFVPPSGAEAHRLAGIVVGALDAQGSIQSPRERLP